MFIVQLNWAESCLDDMQASSFFADFLFLVMGPQNCSWHLKHVFMLQISFRRQYFLFTSLQMHLGRCYQDCDDTQIWGPVRFQSTMISVGVLESFRWGGYNFL